MKATGIILFFFCLYHSSLSQPISIIDTAGQPVPYATFEVPGKKIALFADIKGGINVAELNLAKDDSVIISSIGFNKLCIPYSKLEKQIVLTRQVTQLREVLIYSGKWKEENWGSIKKPKDFGRSWKLDGPGSQFARAIKSLNGNEKPAFIYKIAFYTSHAGNTESPARLRMYEIGKDGLPGNDILTTSFVEKIDKGKGWLEFDLTGHEIRIPAEGLFIGAEYFDTGAQNWRTQKVTYIDPAGKKQRMTESIYGGNFSTDDETQQGETLIRNNGKWTRISFDFIKGDNLVVQVWVKIPG